MNYRVDIQALRGFAVLLVVIYHSNLFDGLIGGYLGVDIFFVISGFLITSQITRQVRENKFSFSAFYLRRAWRLLPAAYLVFLICAAVSPLLLTSIETEDFTQQLLGAISFSANFVLWSQTGYFETESEVKPLLHTWSLSIEEQYYLIMPALIVFLNRRYWILAICLLSFTSLILYLFFVDTKPSAAFYFTFTRVWELGVGSALAVWNSNKRVLIPSWLTYLALLGIALSVSMSLPFDSHKSLNLLITVFATGVIIAANSKLLTQGFIAKPLAKVGTISYSLYLVHWPIFAFLNSANISGHDLWWLHSSIAIIVSFLLATLIYSQIESRFRVTSQKNSRKLRPLVIASALILVASSGVNALNSDKNYSHQMRTNFGLSQKCSEIDFFQQTECQTTPTPNVLIWGDSFAMHLAPGLSATSAEGLMQAARSNCLPIKGISYFNPPSYGHQWAEDCLEFNEQVLKFIVDSESIDLVIMASPWNHILDDLPKLRSESGQTTFEKLNLAKVANAIKTTVKSLKQAGKSVVIVSPPPSVGFDIGKCHERKETNKWSFGGTEDCAFSYASYQAKHANINALMNELRRSKLAIYSFAEKLCDGQRCKTKIDDTILFRDTGHLSYSGSEFYAKKFNMLNELKNLAGSAQN